MWWIFGFINIIIVIGFAVIYHKHIKLNRIWSRDNKVALCTLLIIAFLSGLLGTSLLVGLLIYLIIDFIIYIKK